MIWLGYFTRMIMLDAEQTFISMWILTREIYLNCGFIIVCRALTAINNIFCDAGA
jgi:hypothetical protein